MISLNFSSNSSKSTVDVSPSYYFVFAFSLIFSVFSFNLFSAIYFCFSRFSKSSSSLFLIMKSLLLFTKYVIVQFGIFPYIFKFLPVFLKCSINYSRFLHSVILNFIDWLSLLYYSNRSSTFLVYPGYFTFSICKNFI